MVPARAMWFRDDASREANMGVLLRFNARTPRVEPVLSGAGRQDAKVLLFTGVRYERGTAVGKQRSSRRGSAQGKEQIER